jgi:hypothetical protein
LHAKPADYFLHGPADIFGKGTQRGYPEQLQAVVFAGLPVFWVSIYILYQCAKEYRVGFAASGGGVYYAALAALDVLPGLLLKGKRLHRVDFQPITNDNFARLYFHFSKIPVEASFGVKKILVDHQSRFPGKVYRSKGMRVSIARKSSTVQKLHFMLHLHK